MEASDIETFHEEPSNMEKNGTFKYGKECPLITNALIDEEMLTTPSYIRT